MNAKALRLTSLTVLGAALFIYAGCEQTPAPTPKLESSSVTTTQPGVPGGIVVETHELTAIVTAVDTATRTVTLAVPDGTKIIKCGPEVINFDKIRVKDQVKVMAVEELAVFMAEEGAPSNTSAAALVALSPKGSRPGGVVASTVQTTATVTAIDVKKQKATLKFSDGTTRTVAVRPDVDLTKRKIGEKVVIRVTEAIALSVDKV